MNRILTFTLSALMLSAPALAQTAPEQPKIYADKPNGHGDPSTISCYRPPASFTRVSRLDCKPNSEWARIYADGNRDNLIDTGKMAAGPLNVVH
jgi:hypothetical protein